MWQGGEHCYRNKLRARGEPEQEGAEIWNTASKCTNGIHVVFGVSANPSLKAFPRVCLTHWTGNCSCFCPMGPCTKTVFLLLFDFWSDPLAAGTAPDSILKVSKHPLGRHSCLALAYLSHSYNFKDVSGNGNAEEMVLNLNTICKTSSPNSSANKWIQHCSFSIMGAICVLFSANNAFCKITLNRKCLCCHFLLLTASSQWDLPQHKTDLAIFADWGATFPDTRNTALMEILALIYFLLFFLFLMWDM